MASETNAETPAKTGTGMRARSYLFLCEPDRECLRDIPLHKIPDYIGDEKNFLWLDLVCPDETKLQMVQDTFHFHHLAMEDCLHLGQRPKIDQYSDYLFVILHSLEGDGEGLRDYQIGVFVGKNYVVSISEEENKAVEVIRARIQGDTGLLSKGSDFLLYLLVDSAIDLYFPQLDAIDDKLEEVESKIMEKADHELLNQIFGVRKRNVALRRLCSPLREVVGMLNNVGVPFITANTRVYFRDAYDHTIRIFEVLETYRDLISSSVELYLSMASMRLNEVMKRLTMVATFFMPATFFAGVFGMNVKFPDWFVKAGETGLMLWMLIAFMSMFGVGMLYVIKKMRWIE